MREICNYKFINYKDGLETYFLCLNPKGHEGLHQGERGQCNFVIDGYYCVKSPGHLGTHKTVMQQIQESKKENDPVNHPSLGSVNDPTLAEPELINHPQHYGGDTVYEVIKVLKAWGLEKDALLWTVGKYLGRAGKKEGESLLKDLKKLVWYANKRIEELENAHH